MIKLIITLLIALSAAGAVDADSLYTIDLRLYLVDQGVREVATGHVFVAPLECAKYKASAAFQAQLINTYKNKDVRFIKTRCRRVNGAFKRA